MDETFHAWLLLQNLDQQIWLPELLAALKRRFEKSMERLVIDGRDCQWPQRVHRVSETMEEPR
jgi:hypothetical protein